MEALGINIFSLTIYSILFLGVYLLLEKFLLPHLRKNIQERKALIANTLKDSEILEKDKAEFREVLKAEQKKQLIETSKQIEEMLTIAETEAADIITKAKNKAANLLEDAKKATINKQEKLNTKFEKEVKINAIEILKRLNGKDIEQLNPVELRELLNSIRVEVK